MHFSIHIYWLLKDTKTGIHIQEYLGETSCILEIHALIKDINIETSTQKRSWSIREKVWRKGFSWQKDAGFLTSNFSFFFFFFKFLRSKWWKVKKQREVEAKSKSRGKRSNSVWMLEAEIYKESHSFFSTSIQETFMYQLYVSPFCKKLHYTRWFKKYSIHYSVYYSTW